ncbi:MAG: hypothetical protein IKM28_03415, partial [Lachnospiraceae bacterium]|nr:hypothetical protein [Lachnospiraceae bacterium]
MDRYEYKVRAGEIRSLIAEGEFTEAVKIADTIDWHRVKSASMLCIISDLYKINRRFQESRDVLILAHERDPNGRLIVYHLCELSIKLGDLVQALEYYKEFVQIAPRDTGKYILLYKLYEAQDVRLEERIAVLEELKKRDYREKWAYELAYLYHRVGLNTKCVEECDEMFLWFGEGKYVIKALELKLLHSPLTNIQQKKYLSMKQAIQPTLEDSQKEEEAESDWVEQQANSIEQPTSGKKDDSAIEVAQEQKSEEQPVDEDEIGIQVKTIDMGQYNTMNLQKVVAESMKELMKEEATSDASPSADSANAKQPEEKRNTAARESASMNQEADRGVIFSAESSMYVNNPSAMGAQAYGEMPYPAEGGRYGDHISAMGMGV